MDIREMLRDLSGEIRGVKFCTYDGQFIAWARRIDQAITAMDACVSSVDDKSGCDSQNAIREQQALTALQSENARLRAELDQERPRYIAAYEDAALYRAMLDACTKLPKWWTIEFAVERDAGWVQLIDGDGNAICVDTFGCVDSTKAEQVAEALTYALEHDIPSDAAIDAVRGKG